MYIHETIHFLNNGERFRISFHSNGILSGGGNGYYMLSIRKYLIPSGSRASIIRLFVIILTAYIVFRFVLTPMKIRGQSMEPTYASNRINFCFRLRYLFSEPERFDVVFIRMAGKKVMYLKRVVGLPGETVAFKDGRLLIDGKPVEETYVSSSKRWNLPPRKVKADYVYVVGDNRSVQMERHDFGQTPINRIEGGPLW